MKYWELELVVGRTQHWTCGKHSHI